MKKLAIFASGSGSNAENIVSYFHEKHPQLGIRVSVIVSNNKGAYVLKRAKKLQIPSESISRETLDNKAEMLSLLRHYEAEFIVLAGFLAMVPDYLLEAYPHRIVNIHPALLPSYGGKGMYGMHVHEAVHKAGETKSGITIHEIDNEYDRGLILFQATCDIAPDDSPNDIADHVHQLEMIHFPRVINAWIRMRCNEGLMVRPAIDGDLPDMLHIYAYARAVMKAKGNPNQWSDNYPSEALLKQDLVDRRSYVVVSNDKVVGCFSFSIGSDPTYADIEQGQWLDDEAPYGVIHRIAAKEEGLGLLSVVLQWANNYIDNLRIDTHKDNSKMQYLLEQQGFKRCGIIHLENGDERIAFQRIQK